MKRLGFLLVAGLAGLTRECVVGFSPLSSPRAQRFPLHSCPLSTRQMATKQTRGTSQVSLQLLPNDFVAQLAQSVFRDQGPIPFVEAFGVNAVLFAALNAKLFTMLTPYGFMNAFGLGTMLWTTLGWRGWIYCVLYLLFGQAVTKIRFQEKESKGLAEGRGGRRGPENVW